MRVITKYGNGTLLGLILDVDNNGKEVLGYEVLIDNPIYNELYDDEKEFFECKVSKERIYHCLSIEVQTNTGKIITFGQ